MPLINAIGSNIPAGTSVRVVFFDPALRRYASFERTVVTAEILGEDDFGGGALVQTERLNIGIDVQATDFSPAILGDANLSGSVDDVDLTALATHWQQAGGWAEGDFTGDGFVNDLDLTVLATAWPDGAGPDVSGTSSGGDASGVPEPATLSLLAVLALSLSKGGALAALRRRS